MRRILYLHHILHQDPDSMLFKVLNAQIEAPVKGDWVHLVKQDILDLKLDLTIENIATMSKHQLKWLLKSAVKAEAFIYLSDIQSGHSKTKNLQYSGLKLQPYLSSQRETTIKQKATLFKLRTRMLNVRDNFKSGKEDVLCKCCQKEIESQIHLLSCEKLMDNSLVTNLHRYEDLFLEDADKVEAIGHILAEKFELFKKYNPSAHNAIPAEDHPEDSNDNVRAADGDNSSPVLLFNHQNWN